MIRKLDIISKYSKYFVRNVRNQSTRPMCDTISVCNRNYPTDSWTNITPNILSYQGRNIYMKKNHPLSILRQQIVNYFYKTFVNPKGNAIFSVFDNLAPVVTPEQNFDQLLIPKDHPSRSKSDCYYVNEKHLLRAHTTAHQVDLLKSGLDNYLIVGDVYRRDEINATHFPVFHQIDAVRTLHRDKLFKNNPELEIFETNFKTSPTSFLPIKSSLKCIDQTKQPCHTMEAVKLMEHELKTVLVRLAQTLFGKDIEYRWVDSYFPFTQPSWELEVYWKGEWLELLGSGIMRNEILEAAGIGNTIGWAFGVGLERLAMVLFEIPDIRLFWSNDSGFLNQFKEEDFGKHMKYKPISIYPQCANDLSFWLPDNMGVDDFVGNDFNDVVRDVAGDIVEQVSLIDKFKHPKTGKSSLCFRIVYRHMEKTLTQNEVNEIHSKITTTVEKRFNVKIR
ncbi:putative phenylalanine--tRNA ligase, mitochondrial [Pseudolycoriella hygida]|uniref:phenylalanine--tRNA ligase n=1 Tax=Pseudolycoriella hygida TaxID=35572 RepID=A0A9Q0MXK9_9DIPT|nr:putative phenylalanine--tRNA ligase, mitochondrial [Pseudolycoriella hygida]